MEYRLVGGSDLKVSVLSLGTTTFGGGDAFRSWGQTDAAQATRLADIALDAGITLFNSADTSTESRCAGQQAGRTGGYSGVVLHRWELIADGAREARWLSSAM